ncbi:FAD-dependent oxidoreductase [Aeromicrobium sp. Leaf350]|uniref:FAD-dependent oxidoreductase n=1 Tax=Aeromicrobium sp. Leaf350 TaxID=2876565 RepID=UPI001E3E716A|nr:FAD-dependent oxidoreductase [Aeromicrobium sp. Leaf350]
MPHVVTQPCCGDAACAFACPVNCIHPTPDEPDFATAEMVYIDPISCVDCGACVRACPVGAIKPHTRLDDDELVFMELNALFHAGSDAGNGLESATRPAQAPVPPVVRIQERSQLSVAIVGAGPAALYAADELLKQRGVDVTVLDRLPTPHGLVRAGVAPDHQHTKDIGKLFAQIESQPGFEYRLGVEVGTDVSHDEVLAGYDAVIYATGASRDRRIGVPGEDLPGNATATHVVAWYNGHPDHVDTPLDLSADRVVVVGNGNVALDVARVLLSDPAELARTDIADHALEALRTSAVREVVLVARRGPAEAAFTVPEMVGLLTHPDLDVVVPQQELLGGDDTKSRLLREGSDATIDPDRRRVVLRFLSAPEQILGTDRVEGLRVARTRLETGPDGAVRAVPTEEHELIATTTVLRSVGYRSDPIPGVPFDPEAHRISNVGGRVLTEPGGDLLPRTYVVGWAKRGPTGFIGTNKSCSLETVNALLSDVATGRVEPHRGSRALLADGAALDLADWKVLDAHERRSGRADGRPRRKVVDRLRMVDVVRSAQPAR